MSPPLLCWPGTMATDEPKQDTSPTSAAPLKEPASEPSGPIGRLRHDHLDLDAEERRHHRDKRGGLPVMPIILGLTLLTAIIFYVLHLRAVAKDEAAAKQRAAQAAAAANLTPPPPPPASPAAPPSPPSADATKAAAPPTTAKPADAKPADAKPAADTKPAAAKTDKPTRPAKKAEDKTKNLPRLPVLPEG